MAKSPTNAITATQRRATIAAARQALLSSPSAKQAAEALNAAEVPNLRGIVGAWTDQSVRWAIRNSPPQGSASTKRRPRRATKRKSASTRRGNRSANRPLSSAVLRLTYETPATDGVIHKVLGSVGEIRSAVQQVEIELEVRPGSDDYELGRLAEQLKNDLSASLNAPVIVERV